MKDLIGHFHKKNEKRIHFHRMSGLCLLALSFVFGGTGCGAEELFYQEIPSVSAAEMELGEIPEYQGTPYVEVENGEPDFTEEELTEESYESYGSLDMLGRCTEVEACIGTDLMPTEKRGNISEVKPSGWQSVQYENVEGGSLYNRCHLIGYQLTAENANERNLITGTRYMNTEGMLPFENEVAEYVKETDNHVMYQVTPVFEGRNLVASGVWMEAMSVEDDGQGVSFNVYVYNVQPGIEIDYQTGDSIEASRADGWDKEKEEEDSSYVEPDPSVTYVLNTNTHKFHRPDCASVKDMNSWNREDYKGTREELVQEGYEPCGACSP